MRDLEKILERMEKTKMRFITFSRLIALVAAMAAFPALAQADEADTPSPAYRNLMPLHVGIDKFKFLGSLEFGGGAVENSSIKGALGQDVDMVAIMPMDNLAACSDLKVTYANGDSEDFPLLPPGLLSQNQIYQLGLREDPNDIDFVDARCHAPNGNGVTIGFYGAKGDLFAPVS